MILDADNWRNTSEGVGKMHSRGEGHFLTPHEPPQKNLRSARGQDPPPPRKTPVLIYRDPPPPEIPPCWLIIWVGSDSGGQGRYLFNLLISLGDCQWLVYLFLRRKIERSGQLEWHDGDQGFYWGWHWLNGDQYEYVRQMERKSGLVWLIAPAGHSHPNDGSKLWKN